MDKQQVLDIELVHDDFMTRLFGSEVDIFDMIVEKDRYVQVLKEVQNDYGLKEGHPQFLEWVITCVGRSPVIQEESDYDGPTA